MTPVRSFDFTGDHPTWNDPPKGFDALVDELMMLKGYDRDEAELLATAKLSGVPVRALERAKTAGDETGPSDRAPGGRGEDRSPAVFACNPCECGGAGDPGDCQCGEAA